MTVAWPALYCLFVWWFSTGLIVFLNNLPPRTFRWSFGVASALAAVSFYRLAAGSHDVSVAGLYAAFTYAVFVWGWHEMAFFMGFVTGPRRTACPTGVVGWRRFGLAVQACIDHELAILATGVAVLWATWGAPNQIGLWTFLALWGMRLSAKLNVFLGVLNLGEAFLPAHLKYLLSYMRRRRMNWLMPVSLVGGSLAAAAVARQPATPGTVFVVTMLVLAVLEHAMLVAPVPFEALWGWWVGTSFLKARSKDPPCQDLIRASTRVRGRNCVDAREASTIVFADRRGWPGQARPRWSFGSLLQKRTA